MGRRSKFPGVEAHGQKLRISFFWEDRRVRETLELTPSPANYIRAHKLRSEIVTKINAGVFSYKEYFPKSPRAGTSSLAFETVAEEWFKTLEIAKSTRSVYRSNLDAHWIPAFRGKHIASITPGDFARAVKDREFKSPKTRNTTVRIAQQVFAYALGEGYIDRDPAAGLKKAKEQTPEPDPFTPEETARILEWMDSRTPAANYFRFAFASGLRTSELLDLRWPKIDLAARIARVDCAFVMRESKVTKTSRVRDVELSEPALQALLAQKPLTYLAHDHVFLDPMTDRPYTGDRAPRLIMYRALKALGIRQRPAYNTRHTYATTALMAGANPMWVARQLGHSLQVLLRNYAKWIVGADQGKERAKVDAALGQTWGKSWGTEGQSRVVQGRENEE